MGIHSSFAFRSQNYFGYDLGVNLYDFTIGLSVGPAWINRDDSLSRYFGLSYGSFISYDIFKENFQNYVYTIDLGASAYYSKLFNKGNKSLRQLSVGSFARIKWLLSQSSTWGLRAGANYIHFDTYKFGAFVDLTWEYRFAF
ncbi:MAG: hypothetical protein E7K04_03780 [Helicobacter sp.]|nr:hypothetical protein [Helicobacter sp.]